MSLRNSTLDRDSARGRLLGAIIGGGAIAVMGTFAVSHDIMQPGNGRIVSDSGQETHLPLPSQPSVGEMSLGATTSSVAPETAPATMKAAPSIKAGG
jgi:hypothetical protein